MPKKTDLAAELQDGAPVAEIHAQHVINRSMEELDKKIMNSLCGHINKQAFNIDGLLEDLPCVLPKGHTGDHSAKTKTLAKNPYSTKNPRAEYVWVEGAEYEVKEVVTFWSDAAGKPAAQIAPDYEGLSREEWVQKRRAAQQKQQG
jgi:hypothetical protein